MKHEEATLKEMSDLMEVGLTREVVLEEQRKDAYCRGRVEHSRNRGSCSVLTDYCTKETN